MFEILNEESECVCCPTRDVCTIDVGVTITVTKDMVQRSACNGGFVDAFDDVSDGVS
jgi:hypothetical protein